MNVEMLFIDVVVGRGRNSFLNFEFKWVNERLKNVLSFGEGVWEWER